MDTADIDWIALQNAEQVQQIIMDQLGSHARYQDISRFAKQQGLECSEPVQAVIYCSANASSKWKLVREKWLIEFHLSGDSISQIIVNKGYIGP